jgi:hypothetical protein
MVRKLESVPEAEISTALELGGVRFRGDGRETIGVHGEASNAN